MDSIITLDRLSKTFLTRQKEPGLVGSFRSIFRPKVVSQDAVKGITMSVGRGETLAFIGPNGAGKSTTIKMLTGILHPSSGEARVLGLVPWKDREKLAFRVGSVFGQKSQLWYHLPPVDTFDLLAKIYELDHQTYRRRRDYLVDVFEIGEFLKTPVRKLSLGQRMRCEIAASLLHNPEVIFLDEPTIGLDVVAKQKIRDLIRVMNKEEGTTIFLTSHDAGDIEQLCRRAIIMDHGEIIYDDTVNSLKRDYLRNKNVDLKLGTAWDDPTLPGVKVLKAKDYGVKLEVDCERQSIEFVISRVLARFRVLDMTISDPPMETIIALIYGRKEA